MKRGKRRESERRRERDVSESARNERSRKRKQEDEDFGAERTLQASQAWFCSGGEKSEDKSVGCLSTARDDVGRRKRRRNRSGGGESGELSCSGSLFRTHFVSSSQPAEEERGDGSARKLAS